MGRGTISSPITGTADGPSMAACRNRGHGKKAYSRWSTVQVGNEFCLLSKPSRDLREQRHNPGTRCQAA